MKITKSVIIAGLNPIGEKVKQVLEEEGLELEVIHTKSQEGVDVVGNPPEEEVLIEAGVKEADTIIITLDNDVDSIFTTLLARNLNPDIQILAQATSEEMVNKIYRAGADYVLSLSMVGGRMIARMLLGEEVVDFSKRIRIIKSPLPSKFLNSTLQETKLRTHTGCTLLAVERNGKTHPDIDAEFKFRDGDHIILSGSDENIREFYRRYPSVKPEY